MGWIIAALAALAVFLAYRGYVYGQRQQSLRTLASLATHATVLTNLEPDWDFAAEGYAGIASIRQNRLPGDLAHLAKANAWHFKQEGATELQVLSAFWGGIYAMTDDLSRYEDGIQTYEATKAELGKASDHPKAKLLVAAMLHLHLVLEEFPDEFSRFVTAYRPVATAL